MLDFQKRKKKYFDVTLHDGTKLKIPTPTRRTYDDLMDIYQNPDTAVSELPRLLEATLKTNKEKVPITEEQLTEFDIEDMYAFFTEYANFVNDALSDPNSKSPTTH
jgi:hypothetical protein